MTTWAPTFVPPMDVVKEHIGSTLAGLTVCFVSASMRTLLFVCCKIMHAMTVLCAGNTAINYAAVKICRSLILHGC